jgi:para-aminobenzoate synthetase/4-amino-4-deoxychorismate lyase
MHDEPIHSSPKNHIIVIWDAAKNRWLCFRDPERVFCIHRMDEILPALSEIEKEISENGHFAAGWIAYEAAPAFDDAMAVRQSDSFPLLWFGTYVKPEEIIFTNSDIRQSVLPRDWKPSISRNEYRDAIRKIKQYLENGDTYQVNFSFRLRTSFRKDPWLYFKSLVHLQETGYAGYIHTGNWHICSFSPELFFRLDGTELASRPMKGTISRGWTQADDLKKAEAIRQSEKNRAENVMIVDMVRNDMGRIAETGTVCVDDLFTIEKYPTLWQMTSTVKAKTNASLSEIFKALFPPASITGAPKIRTMEIIKELESTPRRIYTGSVGWMGPNRQAQFNVAIRTVLIDEMKQEAEYGTGGGIVWDSIEQREFEECRIKTAILTRKIPEFSLLETILWTPKESYFLLSYHLKRLKDSADYFSFDLDCDKIQQRLNRFAQMLASIPHKVRLLIARKGTTTLEANPLNNSRYRSGKRIGIAKAPVDISNPFLYHKTTHRQVYEQALSQNPGFEDVILWNEKGEIMESCFANVVVELNGELWTPPVRCGLLAGTYREALLEKGEIKEKIIMRSDLELSAHIYLINSVRKKQEVILDHKLINHKERRTIWVPKEEKSSAKISTG